MKKDKVVYLKDYRKAKQAKLSNVDTRTFLNAFFEKFNAHLKGLKDG